MTNKAGDGESTPLLGSKGVLPSSSLTSSVRSCSNSSTHTPIQRRESGSMRLLETKAPSLVVGDWLSLSNRNQNATTESGDGDVAVLCPGSPVAPPRGTTVGGDTNAQQPLNPLTRLGYAFGHAQNDLCGAMYFSYLLVYMEGIGLNPVDAGMVLIAGQIVDGFATPFVGIFSDNYNCFIADWSKCCWGYAGRRKSWYIFGFILVTTTFWILFTPFPTTTEGGGVLSSISPVMYYAIANSLFQLGWASAQVAHMSMVPEMTPSPHERCFLNSIRYAVTVGTSIAVYILVFITSSLTKSNKNDEEPASSQTATTSEDASTTTDLLWQLQAISYIVLFVGALLGLGFISLVRENHASIVNSEEEAEESDYYDHDDVDGIDTKGSSSGKKENSNHNNKQPKTVVGWLTQTRGFYGVTATYAFSRLCVNIIQLYLPFYVLYAMPTSPSAVATVPLMAYVGMIISSITAPHVSALPAFADAIWLCVVATLILSIGSSFLLFFCGADPQRWGSTLGLIFVFVSSSIMGSGSAQLMITAQTQVGELVGSDPNGGVVFGIASLCDKLSTGVVIFLIQRLVQELSSSDNNNSDDLGLIYRLTAAGGPLVCAILACVSMLAVPTSIRDRKDLSKRASQ